MLHCFIVTCFIKGVPKYRKKVYIIYIINNIYNIKIHSHFFEGA